MAIQCKLKGKKNLDKRSNNKFLNYSHSHSSYRYSSQKVIIFSLKRVAIDQVIIIVNFCLYRSHWSHDG